MVSASVEFAEIAGSSGYVTAAKCDSIIGLAKAYTAALTSGGPHLVHMRIQPGSLKELGRPTVKPPEVARRFRDFLAK
jgi:phosphonopyruvate decarboxylase